MRRPVRVDVSPASKVILLNHVDQTREVFNCSVRILRRWRLNSGFGNPLGLGCEFNVDDDIGVEGGAFAVGGAADGDADVVIEDGKAYVCELSVMERG